MKRALVLSGKGGTGKTTATAAFIGFHAARAFADCDVDAPNLHLISGFSNVEPEKTDFFGSPIAVVDSKKCVGCGACVTNCRFNAIKMIGPVAAVQPIACEGCGVCEYVCPADAISLVDAESGSTELFVDGDISQDGRVFSTAQLNMGSGNSGKLVSQVKKNLTDAVGDSDIDVAFIDGSPGIGCPVIASITGVDLVLVVAEPSESGLSDLQRIVGTTRVFKIPAVVCVNKANLSPELTSKIEAYCRRENIEFLGHVPYDPCVGQALKNLKSVADVDCPARDGLHEVYLKTLALL